MVRREVPVSFAFLQSLVDGGQSLIGGPLSPSSGETTASTLDNVMQSLTPQERLILWLRFWQGYSFRQIQTELNHKSVSQTYRIYKTALSRLKDFLAESE